MSLASEGGEWMLREIAERALCDPVRALEVIAPPARYLDGVYLRVACDLLEMAAQRLRDGTFDLEAFSCVVDDAPATSGSPAARSRRYGRGRPSPTLPADAARALPTVPR